MGQGLNKQAGPVTQIVDKMRGKAREGPEDKENREMELGETIKKVLEEKFPEFDEQVKKWTVNEFCQAIYEVIEEICIIKGAMQFRLPTMNSLQKTFNEAHVDKKKSLDKREFQKIVEEVIKNPSFHVGQGAKDVFLYIFGIPIVALFAKRIIPGPTAAIPDDIFLPAVTSCTAYYLTKTNRL